MSDENIQFRSGMTVELVAASASDLSVVRAARVSTKTESKSDPQDGKLIEFLMKNRHGTPFEHNSMTMYVEAPIFVFREWQRHRVGISYNEQSGRYTEFKPVFYVPDSYRPLVQQGKPGHYEFVPGTDEQEINTVSGIVFAAASSWSTYKELLSLGIAKEVARMVLPVNVYSSMYVTWNARSIMNFLSLRTKREDSKFPSYPQREIEMCADLVEDLWSREMPLTAAAFEKSGRVAP